MLGMSRRPPSCINTIVVRHGRQVNVAPPPVPTRYQTLGRPMKARHLLKDRSQSYYSITPDRTMAEAVEIMMKNNIGALVVMEDNNMRGIITERDVMRIVHRYNAEFATVRVRDQMATDLVLCQAEDSLDQVMELLFHNDTGHRIRHLPVMDNGNLAGIISIADIVNALLTETRFENRILKSYIKNWPEPGD